MQIFAFFNKFNDFIFVVLFSQPKTPNHVPYVAIQILYSIPNYGRSHAKPHPCQNLKCPFGQVHSITAICMISTFFGRKFRQEMSLQRSGKLFLNLFLHFCTPTHRHFINRHFLFYKNTSHVEFNHILHLTFCGNACQFFDCFCVCFVSCFKLINCLFHFRFCSQPDSNRVGSIFLAGLVRIRCVCKPI